MIKINNLLLLSGLECTPFVATLDLRKTVFFRAAACLVSREVIRGKCDIYDAGELLGVGLELDCVMFLRSFYFELFLRRFDKERPRRKEGRVGAGVFSPLLLPAKDDRIFACRGGRRRGWF